VIGAKSTSAPDAMLHGMKNKLVIKFNKKHSINGPTQQILLDVLNAL
jgi:hypothetical protein